MAPWHSWHTPIPLSPPFPLPVNLSLDVSHADSAAEFTNENDIELEDWDDFGDFGVWDESDDGDPNTLGGSSPADSPNGRVNDLDNTTHMSLKTHVLYKTHMHPKTQILDRDHISITGKLMRDEGSPVINKTMHVLNKVYPLRPTHKMNAKILTEVKYSFRRMSLLDPSAKTMNRPFTGNAALSKSTALTSSMKSMSNIRKMSQLSMEYPTP
ncbi:hypothetical protein BGZ80_006393 [Entomortierella chlamydospora]|uniref:Uncharacterized protein n=1 Tax=Entomortierella chlamydospora TaxID=101097 RepID=A0A9P6MGV4_9FUNG|nr:hypothetical protein BGZ80_006393 [Entomortierella chlamydospora]